MVLVLLYHTKWILKLYNYPATISLLSCEKETENAQKLEHSGLKIKRNNNNDNIWIKYINFTLHAGAMAAP